MISIHGLQANALWSSVSRSAPSQLTLLGIKCVDFLLEYTQMLRRNYVHQQADWPRFHWNWERVSPLLASVRHHQGLLLGRVDSLGFDTSHNVTVESLTASVVSSSRIEGEVLDIDQVRSSVSQQLGLRGGGAAERRPKRRRCGRDDAGRDGAL